MLADISGFVLRCTDYYLLPEAALSLRQSATSSLIYAGLAAMALYKDSSQLLLNSHHKALPTGFYVNPYQLPQLLHNL